MYLDVARVSFLAALTFLLVAIARPANAESPAPVTVAAASSTAPIPAPKANLEATAETKRIRFIIGLDRKVDFEIFTLPNPNRVVVVLPDALMRLPDPAALTRASLVQSFHGGKAAPGKNRVVINVAEPVVVDRKRLVATSGGQYQLSLDILPLAAALKARKTAAAMPPSLVGLGLQPPVPKPAESPKLRAARAFKPVIVLDPGHGGDDTGATKLGTIEKNVVLKFGHVLRELLEKTGRYKVLMTRDDDRFIELDERRAFAERHNANLFIAIHADYAGTRARGATIYTLRDRVARDLKGSSGASRLLTPAEVDTVKEASGDVNSVKKILADLAQRDVALTQERTSVFAKSVIETMSENTLMRSEPDQQAAFRVLKTAQFPSVLIELAYVSNRQDAENLKSDEWRGKVAESIVEAVDNYFSDQLARMPM